MCVPVYVCVGVRACACFAYLVCNKIKPPLVLIKCRIVIYAYSLGIRLLMRGLVVGVTNDNDWR